MAEKAKYEIDMCNGSILKKMLIFTLPLMCSGILQLLFNAADIVVVGRFAGDNSLAAVGSNTALINLLNTKRHGKHGCWPNLFQRPYQN